MELDKKDVQEIVSPAEEKKPVEGDNSEGDDKNKNFAELRKQLENERAEKATLLEKLKQQEEGERNLGGDASDDGKHKETDVVKVIFERDKRDAVKEWGKTHSVAADVWAQVKTKVSLKGDETRSEIIEKIDEAYQSLPSVRVEREKKIADEARRKAMSEFNDDELDLGSGGDINLGDGAVPRFTPKEKKILDAMGVTADERKNINKDANPNEWQNGKSPVRKFFTP
jgi:hypothetical protein